MKKVIMVLLILTVLTANVSAASYTVSKCSSTYYCRAATERVSCDNCKVDYTVLGTKDPMTFQFKDLSKGKITYLRWDFGDGSALEGAKITNALKNPTHTFKKQGHYTGCLTIKCEGVKGKLWVHKDLKFTACKKICVACGKCH